MIDHDVQLRCTNHGLQPFSLFPCFYKIHAHEWHIYKLLCQFRMRKLEAAEERKKLVLLDEDGLVYVVEAPSRLLIRLY